MSPSCQRGRLVLSCYDEWVRVYDVRRQTLVGQVHLPHNAYRVARLPGTDQVMVRASFSH